MKNYMMYKFNRYFTTGPGIVFFYHRFLCLTYFVQNDCKCFTELYSESYVHKYTDNQWRKQTNLADVLHFMTIALSHEHFKN